MMTCRECRYNEGGICISNMSPDFGREVNEGGLCRFAVRVYETSVIIRGNREMTREEVNLYIEYLKRKYPGKTFGTITLEEDGRYILITYEELPRNCERIRKIKYISK